MEQEQRDSYFIPPNFIEGGSLLGGIFKTRNVVEAGILAAAVGVPVLQLNISLTARIIILCLTALPLALFALIGVSGNSLTQFIVLFFSYLANRRILNQDSVNKKKSVHPRKAQESEETAIPLNPLADYVPIEKIAHGIIYTKDHRYVKIVEVVPINFLLRSAREQRSIIYSFISYLKIAPVNMQFKVLTKRADINRHLASVRRELAAETDERCRQLQEDYLQLIQRLGSREAITRRFFLIFEYEPLPSAKRGQEETEAVASLQTAARTASNYLRQCGNEVIFSEDEEEATYERSKRNVLTLGAASLLSVHQL